MKHYEKNVEIVNENGERVVVPRVELMTDEEIAEIIYEEDDDDVEDLIEYVLSNCDYEKYDDIGWSDIEEEVVDNWCVEHGSGTKDVCTYELWYYPEGESRTTNSVFVGTFLTREEAIEYGKVNVDPGFEIAVGRRIF